MKDVFFSYLKESGDKILSFYRDHPPFALSPAELHEGCFVYFERGGKRLRPAICRMAAGALGGKEKEEEAIPCALGLELYHNWTLVHDDMIDHDDLRRGKKAVHRLISDRFEPEAGKATADEYGFDVALLAGDALHSAAISYITHLSSPAEVTLKILSLLEGSYGPHLISGEMIDTKNALLYGAEAFTTLSEQDVIEMMLGKTGALFGISALSGALIGTGRANEEQRECACLARFAEACGVAFQLQDDILGVISNEETLGKPIGSDIREGKPTVLLLKAYDEASPSEKEELYETVGKTSDREKLLRAGRIITERGLEYTRSLARQYLEKAGNELSVLPASPYKDLLEAWRGFMLEREM